MKPKRRLAAIMFTDVVGYTAIMGRDESLAVRMIKSHEHFLETLTLKYNGKVINYYGDGSLTIFESAHDAVQCARDLQLALKNDHHVPLRIGLHIGEIIEQESKIFGDGVNIASRIESSGHAGTVLMSGQFHEKVKNLDKLRFRNLGWFRFKNVAVPMEIFALTGYGLADIDPKKLKNRKRRISDLKSLGPYILGGAILFAIFLIIQSITGDRGVGKSEDLSPSDPEQLQRIAIFPFDIKASADLSYLAEGLVDVFSTRIDGVSGYNAIDPNIVIGKVRKRGTIATPGEYATVARELGAGQFLLGNLAKFGDDIRIKVSQYNIKGESLTSAEIVIQELDSLLEAVDRLTRQTIASKYAQSNQEFTATQVLLSNDLDAVTYFLQGEEFRRNGRYQEANRAYINAVETDSTMAFAWMRMWQVCVWNYACPVPNEVIVRNAIKFRDNLPKKMKLYIEAEFMTPDYFGDNGKIAAFQNLIARYGENADFLVGLGEAYFHAPLNDQTTPLFALSPFLKAFKTDPGNAEVVNHVGQLLAYTGDTVQINNILDQIPQQSTNWAVFKAISLLTRRKAWTDADVLTILENEAFNMENVFLRCRSDRYAARFYRLYHDMVRLNNGPFVTPEAPVDALFHFWTGQENRLTSGHTSFLQSMLGLYSIPMYMVEKDMQLRGAFFPSLEEMFVPGRVGHGPYPDDFPLALLAMSSNDDMAFEKHYNAVRSIHYSTGDYGRCMKFLRALYLRKHGAFSASNATLDTVNVMWDENAGQIPNGFLEAITVFTMAENYNSMGDYEKALQVMENQFIVLDTGEDRLLAISLLRRGELCTALDKHQEALDYINQFLDLFQQCDPIYNPWVERAKAVREQAMRQIH